MNIGNTIQVNGQSFVILRLKNFEHKGSQRTAIQMRKPNGRLEFEAVKYENGTISDAYQIS